MKKLVVLLGMIAVFFVITSCNYEGTSPGSGHYSYKIRMTAATTPFKAVNVDIQKVAVIDDEGNTVMLNTASGIVNLQELTNGTNRLLASINLKDPKVKQIKILFGTTNTIVPNTVSYPLNITSYDVIINVNQTLVADAANELVIDFDTNRSVIVNNDNTFTLKPVIRPITAPEQ